MGRNLRFLLVALAALAANVAIAFAVYRVAGIGIQIYSLAGMAVSLGIVAGNILVMAAHLAGQRGSRSFFTAILASTLTTVAPLVATRRLGKGVGPDLADFATITIVNLMVSLAVCLLLVPALIDVLGVERAVAARRRRPGRSTVRAMRAYSAFIAFTLAHRRAMVVLAVLAFGTPLFMLPHHIGSDDYTEYPPSPYVRLYNATIGSKAYEAVRQYSDPLLPRGRSRPFMMRYVAGRYDESPDDHRAPAPWRLRPYCRRAPAPHEADKACAAMERLLMNQGGAGAVENITTEYSAGHGTITCTFSPAAAERGLPAKVYSPAVAIEALAAAMPRPMEAGGYTIRPEKARDYFSLVGSPMAALPAMKPAQAFAVEEQRRVPAHIVRHDQSYMLTLGFDSRRRHRPGISHRRGTRWSYSTAVCPKAIARRLTIWARAAGESAAMRRCP